MHENIIRDELSRRLELIERGMELIDTNYELPNALGAKGYVDILARDRYRNTVVIELKRTTASSREALHELHKYVALLRRERHVPEENVRAILVSIEWHELHVPFSEFVESVRYQVDGYNLSVDADGKPIQVSPVEPIPVLSARTLCPRHMIFLYSSDGGRDEGIPALVQAMVRGGLPDFITVRLDHKGTNPNVVFPAATYVAYLHLSEAELSRARQRIADETGYDPLDPDDFDEEEDDPHALVEEELASTIVVSVPRDDFEIGYPSKFLHVLDSWEIVDHVRHGDVATMASLESPESLVVSLSGVQDGTHHAAFGAFTSTRHRTSFEAARLRLDNLLVGMEHWRSVGDRYLDEILNSRSATDVSIIAFNPASLIFTLVSMVTEASGRLPHFEIHLDGQQSHAICIGHLVWDGRTMPNDPEQVVIEAIRSLDSDEPGRPDFFSYLTACHLGEQWIFEERLLELHGLRQRVAEFRLSDGQEETHELRAQQEALLREPLVEAPSLKDFLSANLSYVEALLTVINQYAHPGFVGPADLD